MTKVKTFAPSSRYRYDFGACSSKLGWAQIDTRQDASYFGQWINPALRQIFSYCEGDCCLTTCANDAELVAELEHIRAFHDENDKFLGLDPGFNEELKAAIISAGLGSFFHASERCVGCAAKEDN